MLIFIKTTLKTGPKFDLEVPPGTTVAEMKDMVEAAEGMSYDSQRYIFKGKLLRSDQTLEECGVQDEDTLYLVVRQVMPLGDNAPVDLLSKNIREQFPARGAQDVSVDAKIMVSFLSDLGGLERMLIRVGEAGELGPEVPGCTHLVPGSQTICFIPLSALKPGTRYYVRCSTNPESLRKAAPFADLAEWWFKTGMPSTDPVRLKVRQVNLGIVTQVMFQPTKPHARKAFLTLMERYGLKEDDVTQIQLYRSPSEYNDTLSLYELLLHDADFSRLQNGDTVIVESKAKTNFRAESSTRDKKAAETPGFGDDGKPELHTSIGLGTAVGVGLLVLGLFAMSMRSRRA